MKTKKLQDKLKKKETKGLRFSERDRELIRWSNSFGFCTSGLVRRKWGVSRDVANRRLKQLYGFGFFRREKLFWDTGYIYIPTGLGLDLIDDEMPPIKQASPGTFMHSQAICGLSIELEKQGGRFQSERRFRRELMAGKSYVGIKGHIPDGLYFMPGSEKAHAIEVELTLKTRKRRAAIAEEYRYNYQLAGVKYFTDSDSVEGVLRNLYADDPHVTIERFENEW